MRSTAFEEQLAIMGHRLDAVIAEAERLERELDVIGERTAARDLAHIALDVRLTNRSLARLCSQFDPSSPLRPELRSLHRTIA